MIDLTPRQRRFVAANRISPVVYGSVLGNGGKGCFYRLADGQTFTLTARDCATIGQQVRWAFYEKVA